MTGLATGTRSGPATIRRRGRSSRAGAAGAGREGGPGGPGAGAADLAAARPAGRRVHRPGTGQGPGPGDRRAAAHRPAPGPVRAHLVAAEPAHVLHRQPRHGQDDRGHAHGRAAARARLPAQGPAGQRHPGRPGRPVRGPHRPEDQGGAQTRDGRGAPHRRGVLPVPAGERARLRPGVDRDPAAVHGGAPGGPGGDPGRLRRPDGHLLPVQPGHGLPDRPSHRLPRLHPGRAAPDRGPDAGARAVPALPRRPGGVRGVRAAPDEPAAVRQRAQHPQRDRPAAAAPGAPAGNGRRADRARRPDGDQR